MLIEAYKKYKVAFDTWFEKNRTVIGLFLIVLVFFSSTFFIIQGARAGREDQKTIKSTDIEKTKGDPSQEQDKKEPENKEIVFDIEGAVKNPGVYRLPAGSVMFDAINKAGGMSAEADRDRIARELNQASPIGNNAKLYIFKKSDKDFKVVAKNDPNATSNQTTEKSISNSASAKININKATLAELDALPGIGPAIAQRIIDWRSANGGFEVIEDLKKVKGIGDSLFEGVKAQIVIE